MNFDLRNEFHANRMEFGDFGEKFFWGNFDLFRPPWTKNRPKKLENWLVPPF
jgi:hypothetical protein